MPERILGVDQHGRDADAVQNLERAIVGPRWPRQRWGPGTPTKAPGIGISAPHAINRFIKAVYRIVCATGKSVKGDFRHPPAVCAGAPRLRPRRGSSILTAVSEFGSWVAGGLDRLWVPAGR